MERVGGALVVRAKEPLAGFASGGGAAFFVTQHFLVNTFLEGHIGLGRTPDIEAQTVRGVAVAAPPAAFTRIRLDEVRQLDAGVDYADRWRILACRFQPANEFLDPLRLLYSVVSGQKLSGIVWSAKLGKIIQDIDSGTKLLHGGLKQNDHPVTESDTFDGAFHRHRRTGDPPTQ